MDGRKIKSEYENPIDNILITLCIKLGKILKKYTFFTPNVFTTISLIIALIGLYYIYYTYYKIGSILYFISYFFDCLDGNFARKYNMVTDFGDLYDHASDITKYILLVIIILYSKLKIKTKFGFLIIVFLASLFGVIHLGCQQQFYNDNSCLNNFKIFCPDKTYIIYTRYLGCGTIATLISLYFYNIEYINKIL